MPFPNVNLGIMQIQNFERQRQVLSATSGIQAGLLPLSSNGARAIRAGRSFSVSEDMLRFSQEVSTMRGIEEAKKRFRVKKQAEKDSVYDLTNKLRTITLKNQREEKNRRNTITLPDGLFVPIESDMKESVARVFESDLIREANKRNKKMKYLRKKERQRQRKADNFCVTESDEKCLDWDEKEMEYESKWDLDIFAQPLSDSNKIYATPMDFIAAARKDETMSGLSDIPMTENTFLKNFRDLKRRIMETVDSNTWKVCAEWADKCIDFFIILFLCKQENDSKKVVMYVHLLMGKFGVPLEHKIALDTAIFLVCKIRHWWSKDLPVTESLSDNIASFSYAFKSAMSGGLVKSIRDLFITLNSFQFFPPNVASNISRYFGEIEGVSVKNLDLMSVCVIMMDALSTLVRAAEMYRSGCSLSDLLFTKNPVSTAINAAKRLVALEELTYSGLPVPGQICRKQYVREARECLPIMKDVIDKGNPTMPGYNLCMQLYFKLYAISNKLENLVMSETRTPPACIVLHGDPGIGKSVIMGWLFRIFADAKCRPFHDNEIYHKNAFDNYWEGYSPLSHFGVHIPELGSLKKDIVKMKGDVVIQELTSIIDSNTYLLNMAFEGKGKTPFLAEVMVLDCNDPTLNIPYIFNNPAAFNRRFLFVHPRVKDEYKQKGGVGIDNNLAMEAGNRLIDKYYFDIYRKQQLNNVESNIIYDKENVECDEAYDAIRQYFMEFIGHQEEVRAKKVQNHSVVYGHKFRAQDEARRADNVQTESYFTYLIPIYARFLAWLTFYYARNWWIGYSATFFLLGGLTNISNFLFAFKQYYFTVCCVRLTRYLTNKFIIPLCYLFFFSHLLLSIFFRCSWFDTCWRSACMLVFLGIVGVIANVSEEISVGTKLDKYIIAKNALMFYFRGRLDRLYDSVNRNRKLFFFLSVGTPLLYGICICAAHYVLTKDHVDEKYELKDDDEERNKKRTTQTEGSEFSKTGPAFDQMRLHEQMMGADGSFSRTKGKSPEAWNYIHVKHDLPFSGDPHGLALFLKQNTRNAILTCKLSNYETKTVVVGLQGNIVLINTHALPVNQEEKFEISISNSPKVEDGPYKHTIISGTFRKDLGNDLSLLYVSQMQFKNILRHIADVDFQNAVGFIGENRVHITSLPVPQVALDKRWEQVVTEKPVYYHWEHHSKGKCGTPIVIKVGENKAAFVGIHFAGHEGNHAFGTRIDKKKLIDGIFELENRPQLQVYSESDEVASLLDPVPKSPFNFIKLHNLDYIGYDGKGILPMGKSKLKKSKIHANLSTLFAEVINFKPSKDFMPPLMVPKITPEGDWVSPYNVNLNSLNVERKPLDRDVLMECVDTWIEHIMAGLPENRKKLNPLDLHTAVNGDLNDAYLRRINTSTGAGYGFKGKKGIWLPIVKEEHEEITREPTEELMDRLMYRINEYKKKCTPGTIYGAKLKDEPRSAEKVKKGETRMFYPSPVDHLILSRMVLGPVFTLMVEFGDLFFSSVGINMHTDGGKIYEKLAKFLDDKMKVFEGDYKKFDTSCPFDIQWAVVLFLYRLCKRLGYGETALNQLVGVLMDVLFARVEVNGDIFGAAGIQPSGCYGTAEMNVLRNALMLMYFFAMTPGLSLKQFFTELLVFLYGDDVLIGVKNTVAPFFNVVEYAKFCDKHYGVGFTSSDKKAELTPFIHIDNCSFLKRKFVEHKEHGHRVAALDMDSIFRMLYWIMPSENVTEYDQMVSIANSALWEMYMHLSASKWLDFKLGLCALLQDVDELFPIDMLVTYDRIDMSLCPIAMPFRGEEEAPIIMHQSKVLDEGLNDLEMGNVTE